MSYRVELSDNNRAGCKNKECKDAGVKILKGELRFATYLTIKDYQSWAYKHWGCVTPKQLQNVKEAIDSKCSNLDGFDELPENLQNKIERALHFGHVADEDWKGDIEMNRVGKNGFRTPQTKKSRKEKAKAAEDGSASPSKSQAEKRSHVTGDSDAEDAQKNKPPAKKLKKPAKKKKGVKAEDTNQASDDETKPAKRGRKKASSVKAEAEAAVKYERGESEDDSASPQSPVQKAKVKRNVKGSKKVKDEDLESDGFGAATVESKALPKRTRAPRKATVTTKYTDDGSSDEEMASEANETPAPKKTRAPRKSAKVKHREVNDTPSEAQDAAALTASKKSKASRKTRTKHSSKAQEDNANEDSDGAEALGDQVSASDGNEENALEVASKHKKSGKKAPKKSGKGKVLDVADDASNGSQ